MRRIMVFAIAALFLPTASAFAQYSGGSGSEADPWQISCPNDLLYLAAHPADYNSWFVLTADIDLGGHTFTTAVIAPDTSTSDNFQGTKFTGTFDGDGFVIRNLTIDTNGAGTDYLGLFGFTGSGSEIKNLGIKIDINIDGDWSDDIGGLVGENNHGTISNCYTTGNVIGSEYSYSVGGLVGKNNKGSISGCHSTGAVSSGGPVGGLVGENNGGSISQCYSTSTVDSWESSCVGGLVGENDSGSISQCYSTGTVYPFDSFYVGGLVGENSYGSISECHSTCEVDGYGYVGGLVGWNSGGTISNCYANGIIAGIGWYGLGNVGGLVGGNDGTITNCYATGEIDGGDDFIGGLVGGNGGIITNCYATGEVIGDFLDTGGLVGGNGGTITNCYATGAVVGYENSERFGGLVGDNGGSIVNCYAAGIVAVGDNSIDIGGLVGLNEGITISNCYAKGAVTGGNNSKYLGGLVGENWSGPISNCFWDKQTSGRHNGVGLNDGGAITNLLGKTTSQMRIQSTFSGSPAYWDFVGETANGTEDVWRMCVDGVNYPQLYWQFVNRRGDFVCPDGVDFADLAFFTKHWLQTGCTLPEYCNGADLDKSGIVNFSDFGLLAEHWLTE